MNRDTSTRGQWARSDRLKGLQSEGPSSLLLADPSSYPSIFEATDEFEAAEEIQGPGFAGLGLPNKLVRALANQGITEPFPIQVATVPDVLAGRDVLGRGQTGSGKTLAFGLPMIARLTGGPRSPRTPRGLVLVPTRELAVQVRDALEPLGHALGVKTVAVFGGAPLGRQIATLERGVDIVVATPGLLLDLHLNELFSAQ